MSEVRALVSVHDVMPGTLAAVETLCTTLGAPHSVTLLVVPGAGWSESALARLQALQAQGYRLAAHGWRHHVTTIRRPYHRLHSWLFSRQVAEHLALDAEGILALLHRSHAWFADHGLNSPQLYVPPAWAMGSISRARLMADGPFELYEYFNGVFDAVQGCHYSLPLLGYEADRALRVPMLTAWNQLNRWRAARYGWVRIGLHPHDCILRLAQTLSRDLAHYHQAVDYMTLRG